jgi:hypothetical protein
VIEFDAVLEADAQGPGAFVTVPEHVKQALGLRGRPKVKATIAGHPYRGSLMPARDGALCLGVLKSIQAAAGVRAGDTITVELAPDTDSRTVEAPPDLAAMLADDTAAAETWARLSYTNKKEIAISLESAKKPETRSRRLEAALATLRSRRG